MEDLVPKPILFNCWKHHFDFLLAEIRKHYALDDSELLKMLVKKIGKSTTDLYIGTMDIPEVVDFCVNRLKRLHRFRKNTYLTWLSESQEEYRLMEFPDGSVWVLKIGTEEGRHIHIHPGRNVPHTIRVKATILKTSWLVNLYALNGNNSPMDIHLINHVRKEILGLSPIKFVTMNHDLGKMIYLFGSSLRLLN